MSSKIDSLTATFIWVETFPALLRASAPPSFLEGLSNSAQYKALFQQMQFAMAGPVIHDGEMFGTAWWESDWRSFWAYYLERLSVEDIGGVPAWEKAVPFRWRPHGAIHVAKPQVWMTEEIFCYPFGFGVMLTVLFKPTQQTLDHTYTQLLALRQDRVFSEPNQGQGGSSTDSPMSLVGWGRWALAYARTKLSDGQSGVTGDTKPFSIVTITRGSGVDPAAPLVIRSDTHALLHQFTEWEAVDSANLPPLTTASLKIRKAAPSDLVYADRRGRIIWMPRHFTKPDPKESLDIYHRNMAFAALQTEMLSTFLRATITVLNQEGQLPQLHDICARNATRALARLYHGVNENSGNRLYRTHSVQRHIADSVGAPRLNQLLDKYDIPHKIGRV